MSRFESLLIVAPMPDGSQWALQASLVYVSDIAGRIVVPPSFCTDFASIPRALWPVLPPWSRYGPAAIVHDWLYWSQAGTREQADSVLREAMTLLGVEGKTVEEIYLAVHLFGQDAWTHNAALKASGYSRMAGTNPIPPYAQLPELNVGANP